MKRLMIVLGLLAATTGAADESVTVASLLRDMTDPDVNTYLPKVPWTARLWSSYDRRTTTPDKGGWFANDDYNQFVRSEKVGDCTEDVMVDAKGPGAVTRFWITTTGAADQGDIRIYVDGKLLAADRCQNIVSGGLLCAAPLSDSVSKQSPRANRGHNLYLPIPYAQSCRIVYVRKGTGKDSFYYNVETRSYPDGTAVESLTPETLKASAPAIAAANRTLSRRLCGMEKPVAGAVAFAGTLKPGERATRAVNCAAGGAVRRLAFTLPPNGDRAYLRSTVLELSFDGERTVWAPIGDFFGCGTVYESVSGWFTSCPGTDRFESRWTMPFAKICTLTLHNFGTRPVSLEDAILEVGPYAWDDARSLHFGACWHAYSDAGSRRGSNKEQWDYDYAELTGAGFFVGTTLTLWQPVTDWWGEGDEKIFVDGERAPSFVGTGTEDHYGYAWCRPEPFSHPFLLQAAGVGTGRSLRNGLPRRDVANVRTRALDAIPFTSSIRYLMEMWHWRNDVYLDFAPLACWYMRPGGKANHGPDIAAVQRPIRIDAGDSPEPARVLPKTARLLTDFEDGTYGGWTATGDAFGAHPARGAFPNQQPVAGYSGRNLVNTYIGNSDEPTGTLTSPAFTIEKPFLNFLVGGGSFAGKTCVNLEVDGKVVRTVTGKDQERLESCSWNVAAFTGRTARIVIVDASTGAWGHINADCFYFDNLPWTK